MKRISRVASYAVTAAATVAAMLAFGAGQPAGRQCVGIAATVSPRSDGKTNIYRVFSDGTVEILGERTPAHRGPTTWLPL